MIFLKLTKLDRRYSGNTRFSHRVEFSGSWKSKAVNFVRARNWCWDRFGASAELDKLYAVSDDTPLWAWESEHNTALYLRDTSLTQFLLIKEQFEVEYD